MAQDSRLLGLYMAVIFALLLAIIAPLAFAAQVKLDWDHPGGATGFRMYCATTTPPAGTPLDVPGGATRSVTLTLQPGPNFCAVSAYNAVAETGKSNIVSIPLPPDTPGNLRFEVTSLTWSPEQQMWLAHTVPVQEVEIAGARFRWSEEARDYLLVRQ